MLYITVPIIVWGLRLTIYLVARHKSEDWRHAKLRTEMEAKGNLFYYVNMYFVFFGGTFSNVILNVPALHVNLYDNETS